MTTHIGVWEHARHTTPRTEHGFCTDDNARGLIVVSRQPEVIPSLLDLAWTYFRFLEDAALPGGGFHNRRRSDGSWSDAIGSDDSQGRAVWALGTVVRIGVEEGMRGRALEIFERQRFTSPSPRANALAILGAADVLAVEPAHRRAREALTQWAEHLSVRNDPNWHWPEERLSYDNARIPEALMAAGAALGDDDMVESGVGLLRWLVDMEMGDGHFSFTPAGGWAPGEPRPGFDQQPVEAAAMADACSRAWAVTHDPRWREDVVRAARWFVGVNDQGVILYDAETGGCSDGLMSFGPNLNQGAESTLAALSTLQRVGTLEHAFPDLPASRLGGGSSS